MNGTAKVFDKLAGPIFLCLGVGAFAFGLSGIYRARRSNSWQSTRGVIVGSWRGEHNDGYSPKVLYRYKVVGAAYESRRIRFGGRGTSDRATAESWLARNKAGAAVPVYYDPDHPSEAVLERGVSAILWLPVGLGTLFAPLGLLLLRGYWHYPSDQGESLDG